MTIATPNTTAKYSCGHCLAPSSRCQAHLASRRSPPATAHTPKTRLSATNARAKGPDGGTGLSKATSNGEVEGPPRSARSSAVGAQSLPRPRRVTTDRSRTPPTIVRRLCYEARACTSHSPHRNNNRRLPLPERRFRQRIVVRSQLQCLWRASPGKHRRPY
jgi:hypothetical protein